MTTLRTEAGKWLLENWSKSWLADELEVAILAIEAEAARPASADEGHYQASIGGSGHQRCACGRPWPHAREARADEGLRSGVSVSVVMPSGHTHTLSHVRDFDADQTWDCGTAHITVENGHLVTVSLQARADEGLNVERLDRALEAAFASLPRDDERVSGDLARAIAREYAARADEGLRGVIGCDGDHAPGTEGCEDPTRCQQASVDQPLPCAFHLDEPEGEK